jgi:folate-binding protein YgfZ
MSRPDYGVIRFSGEDAHDFLQGQFTNNLLELSPGHALRAAYCTPQGRVITLLTLLLEGPDVLAVLPRSLVSKVAGRLAMYVLRSKVRISDVSDEMQVASSEEPESGLGTACQALQVEGEIRWLASSKPTLAFRISRQPATDPLSEYDASLAVRALIRCGLPELEPGTSEQFVPQMLNLDLLQAISFAKGCYTGQEIIARTQNLGRIKRRLVALLGKGSPPAAGTGVASAGQVVGQVVLAAPTGGGFEALAVIRLETIIAGDGLNIDGRELELGSVPYPIPELANDTG